MAMSRLNIGISALTLAAQIIAFTLILVVFVAPHGSGITPGLMILENQSAMGSAVKEIGVGMLGAYVEYSNGESRCKPAQLRPDLTWAYAEARLDNALILQLPPKLIDLPNLTVFVISCTILSLLLTIASALPVFVIRMEGRYWDVASPVLLRVALAFTSLAAIFDLTVAACFASYFSQTVKAFRSESDALELGWSAHRTETFTILWSSFAFLIVGSFGLLGSIMNRPPPQIKLGFSRWA